MASVKSGDIVPCLWFDYEAEEAARFYVSIFSNSEILQVTHYGKAGHDVHGQPEGKVMTVDFVLNGQRFTALNGGPVFKFNPAVSFQVFCGNQTEIDYYWAKLTRDGEEQPCGWLKDKYGLSWQVVPTEMGELMKDPVKAERVTAAFMKMRKLDIEKLRNA